MPEVLKRTKEHGCEKVMLTTMTLPGAQENHRIVKEHPDTCTMTLGVHPYHAGEIYAKEGYPLAKSDSTTTTWIARIKRPSNAHSMINCTSA